VQGKGKAGWVLTLRTGEDVQAVRRTQ